MSSEVMNSALAPGDEITNRNNPAIPIEIVHDDEDDCDDGKGSKTKDK